MHKRSPFLTRVKQAVGSRKIKTRLLPMRREKADEVAFHYHAALASVRAQQVEMVHLQRLLQMVILSGFIADVHAIPIQPDVLRRAERSLVQAVDRAQSTGIWTLDEPDLELCAAILTHHDHQLRTAPLAALEQATQRLDRLVSDQPYDHVHPIWRRRK